MKERTLFDLHREADELRIRLARLEDTIRRIEHQQWREFNAERRNSVEQVQPQTLGRRMTDER